jgi:hypothetical protein
MAFFLVLKKLRSCFLESYGVFCREYLHTFFRKDQFSVSAFTFDHPLERLFLVLIFSKIHDFYCCWNALAFSPERES